ncbi:MAG: nitroreductase [Chloroflexi bacterium]|jgi:nitroreductase|nr:nitroreductase [Chloroflexota bacterium]MBT7082178.1 nitroreductase [Chloroflexota bacterium]MBT7288981.1 nitroreductase [Chloroflexota bacterium]
MDLMQAIKERRSIRKFKSDPVSNEDLNKVLEAARWAPSWANTQCSRIVVVQDYEKRDQLAKATTSSRPGRENGAAPALRQAPIVIVACAELNKSGCFDGLPSTDKNEWYMYDVALSMEHMVLAAHALGLGTVHMGLFDAAKVAEILSVPQGHAVVAMTPLGYPDEAPAVRPRKNIDQIVYSEKFGEK